MGIISRSIQRQPDSNGNIVTARPEPNPTIIWATVPDFENRPQGTNFTHDLSQYVGGQGSASATLSLQYVAGDSASAFPLTVTAGVMSTSADTVAAGSFRGKAVHDGVTYLSNAFNFSVVAPGSDSIAPPPPLFLSWSASVSGASLTCLVPTDPKLVGVSADGMKNVIIEQSSAGAAFAVISTASVSAGISPQAQDVVIGVQSGSASQTSSDVTIYTKSSAGLTPNMDDITFRYWTVNGDHQIVGKIPQFSAPGSAKHLAGLMVRQAITSGSKLYIHSRLTSKNQADGASRFTEIKYRANTSGSLAFLNPQSNLSGDVYFRVKSEGSQRTGLFWRVGDSSWTENDTRSIPMNSTVFVGVAANAGATDDEMTAQFEDVYVTKFDPVTISVTGLQPGTQYDFRAKATDLGGNQSDYGPTVIMTTGGSAGAPSSTQWNNVLVSGPPDVSGQDNFTITTRASLDNYISSTDAGGDHPGGLIYRIDGVSANQNFVMDLSSASAGTDPLFYPLDVNIFKHIIIRGIKTKWTVQAGADTNELFTSGQNNFHPRLPRGWGFRLDCWGDIFMEGCDINGECWSSTAAASCAFNADFVVTRSNRTSDYITTTASSETQRFTFVNGRKIGNTGQDALHADYMHTQHQASPTDKRHIGEVIYENVLGESGQESGVYQDRGDVQLQFIRYRRVAMCVTQRFVLTLDGRGTPLFTCKQLLSAPSFEDVYAGRDDGSWPVIARVNRALYAGDVRVDYTAANAPSTSGQEIDPELTYINSISASAPTFNVSADSVGYGYVSPWGPISV